MAKILVTGGCGYIGSHTIVDLIEKYVNKKYRINFFENLCKNLVLKNNAKLAKAIANSFSKKSKRKDYCYYGISKGLILSYRLLKSVKAAKLIENKKLKIEILK